ncbi:MAG: helix-turn-helix transcriptional regulator [Ruminococcus sp.]|nr:helix-turn-helix transcriptional regulator [Ruminococcus sp.]
MADKDFSAIAIGKRITAYRKMLGLTQEELAEKGDMTTQFVSYAESGKRVIRSENLLKLSKALEVSADFLLTGEIVDKDMFIMSEKLSKLSSKQFKFIESIVDKCNELF